MYLTATLLLAAVVPTVALTHSRTGNKLHIAPVTVRIIMEPGCEHCRKYMMGPVQAALADDSVVSVMELDVSYFGNAFYAIPECEKADGSGSLGCGGAGGYDANRRVCFNQKCGPTAVAESRAADCFAGPLITQFGFPQLYTSRFFSCAKRESQREAIPWKRYVPFFVCMEELFDRIHDGVSTSAVAKTCADKTDFNYDKLTACFDGKDAEQGLRDEAAATPDHPGVPYVFVNGQALDESYEENSLIEAVRSASASAESFLVKQSYVTGSNWNMSRNITC